MLRHSDLRQEGAISTSSSQQQVNSSLAVGLGLLLWVGYTTLQTLFVVGLVDEATSALLGFVPGILGVAVLLVAGLSREDCFLQFQRLSARPTGGETSTGLGLSIARKFVRMHGGKILVDSELDRGSTFTIELPIQPPPGSPTPAAK